MNDALMRVVAGAAGLALGAVFFGGLLWTVRRGVSSPRPALWFIGSMLLRTGIVLAGFYFVGGGQWQRLMACLLGFVIARFLVTRLTSNSSPEKGRARVPRASSGVSPERLSPTHSGLSGSGAFAKRGSRRDAENNMPEARAPRSAQNRSPTKEARHAP